MVQQPTKQLLHTKAQGPTAAYEATAMLEKKQLRGSVGHSKNEEATATNEATATFGDNNCGDQPEAELKSSLECPNDATAQEATDTQREPSTTNALQRKLDRISLSRS